MRTRSKLLFVALTATVIMSFAVSASARRIELSNQNFLAMWSPLVFEAAGNNVSCPVTLEGEFHSKTLSKVCGQLVGYITSAFVGEPASCAEGEATILPESLPWHVRYNSFAGTLPSITSITLQLVGAAFRVHSNSLNQTCLTGTTASHPAFGIVNVAAGVGRTLRADETKGIPLHEGFTCEFLAGEGHFKGTGEVFQQAAGLGLTTTRITVRLVQ